MTKIKFYFISISCFFLIFLFCVSCQSSEPVFTEDMTPEDYFQKAQEAYNMRNYKVAILYYEKFIEIFPAEIDKKLWAAYEIGFIYYKMKEYETALSVLKELLLKYEEEGSDSYPQGPRILAEKIIVKIEDILKEQGKLEEEQPESEEDQTNTENGSSQEPAPDESTDGEDSGSETPESSE